MTNMWFKKKKEQERDLFQQQLDLIQQKALKHFPENPQRTEMEIIALERALTQTLQEKCHGLTSFVIGSNDCTLACCTLEKLHYSGGIGGPSHSMHLQSHHQNIDDNKGITYTGHS